MSKSFLVLFFKKEHLPSSARVLVLAALPLLGLLVGPAYASVAWLYGALGLLRGRPALDVRFAVIGAGFCALCAIGAAWSIAPEHSLAAAGQLALILAASLVVLADRSMSPAAAARALGAMSLALCAGVAVMCVDRALGFPLQRHLAVHAPYPGTKYNRGEDYLTLLLWPLLAYWVLSRRYLPALLVMGAVVVAAAAGLSTTARVTLPVGLLTLVCAWIVPRATMFVLCWGSTVLALGLPFVLRSLSEDRALLWGHLKQSGLHRLEIWDYMTARVFERPWLGWGFSTAKLVPIWPEEQRSFVYVDPHGVYPHNQLLQLWLEAGFAGVVFGLVFVLLVLRGIARLPRRLYPFGCAAFAASFSVSASSFEITTDSWWAALAMTAVLLRLAGVVAVP